MKNIFKKNKIPKTLAFVLEFLAFVLFGYLLLLPIIPNAQYQIADMRGTLPESKDVAVVRHDTEKIINTLPENKFDVSPNRLIITKIGVNAPIVESASSEYGLSLGAWHVPESSSPEKGGNTVITGHRFKYLPPSNLTFYLLDKLEAGDLISVVWKNKKYYYKVRELKIVEPTDLSVEAKSEEPILTLYTCHPIYSTAKRLVVVADLISGEN